MEKYEEWDIDDYIPFKHIKQKPKYNNNPAKIKDKTKRKKYKKAREIKNEESDYSW